LETTYVQNVKFQHKGLNTYFLVQNVKIQGLDTCYHASAYSSQTNQQQCFIVLEKWKVIKKSAVSVDWHEPMVLSITDNFTHGAACRHTVTAVSHHVLLTHVLFAV